MGKVTEVVKCALVSDDSEQKTVSSFPALAQKKSLSCSSVKSHLTIEWFFDKIFLLTYPLDY